MNSEVNERKTYFKLKEIFKRITNNNKIYDYNHHFNLDEVDDNHVKVSSERLDYLFEISDYYFIIDGVFYTLDMSHNPDDFGLGDYYKYNDNIYYCQLCSYVNNFDNLKSSMLFMYDRLNDKIIESIEIKNYPMLKRHL